MAIQPISIDLRLNASGLVRIYLSTWPYIFAELKHFIALLGMTLTVISFGTAVAFLGFDVLWDSVGQGARLSSAQASIMLLPEAGYVDTDELTKAARQTVLIRFLILTAVIVVVTTTVAIVIQMYKAWILQRVNQRLRTRMVANAEELSLRFHSQSSAGDAIYRVFQDSAMVTAVVDNIVVVPLIGLTTLTMQLAIASLFSPWFGSLLLIGIVSCVALLVAITPRLRTLSLAARQASATLFTRVQETFQSIQAIKAYGFETSNHERFQSESTQAIDTAFSLRREFAIVKVCTAYILVLVLFVTDYIATRYVLEGGVVFGASLLVLFGLSVTAWTVATHQARRGSVEAFKSTFEDLIRVWCLAQDMAVGLGRAFWLLDLEPEVTDAENPEPFPDVHQGVSFHNVTFGYRPESPVLEEVNLTARVGEVIALVGPSGSGKSTLVSMLLRLFDPDNGHIKIDETDIRSIKIETLRKNVAIALQENILFPVSIEDNLRYAAPDVSDSQLHSSVKIACAEFIEELPQGYRTELGVGGALLSTGQKQRLSIARALVRNTRILILDEPTASLDAQTERRFLTNLRIWAKEKIVFIVTHRPSTIRDADRVVFLKNGRITETGTHEELLRQRGDYQRFVSIEVADD